MKKPLLYRSFGSKDRESDFGKEGDDENCSRAERETKFWEVGWSFLCHLWWICGVADLAVGNPTNRVVGAEGLRVGFVMLSEIKRHFRGWSGVELCGSSQSPSQS